MSDPIRVLISGGGKMGRAIADGLDAEPSLDPVAVVDKLATAAACDLPSGRSIPVHTDAAVALDASRPDVVVDFTNAAWTPGLVRAALERGVRPVIGTTGLPPAFVDELAGECRGRRLGAVLAANFAIGAVLLMHMAAIASRFFDAAEIIELHHDQKVDAPSGTAIATARAMTAARAGRPFHRNVPQQESLPGTRTGAVDGVTVHSVRLPGLFAHQEVIFGGQGQTLTLRHDTSGRDCYLPGIVLACREVMRRQELVVGLDALVGLAPGA
jgi:4-hydroxy-tetrahydrodipicolinate reductase